MKKKKPTELDCTRAELSHARKCLDMQARTIQASMRAGALSDAAAGVAFDVASAVERLMGVGLYAQAHHLLSALQLVENGYRNALQTVPATSTEREG